MEVAVLPALKRTGMRPDWYAQGTLEILLREVALTSDLDFPVISEDLLRLVIYS
jgi:hypothetical protein